MFWCRPFVLWLLHASCAPLSMCLRSKHSHSLCHMSFTLYSGTFSDWHESTPVYGTFATNHVPCTFGYDCPCAGPPFNDGAGPWGKQQQRQTYSRVTPPPLTPLPPPPPQKGRTGWWWWWWLTPESPTGRCACMWHGVRTGPHDHYLVMAQEETTPFPPVEPVTKHRMYK